MKAVIYSTLNKTQTVIASLITGCEHTSAINDKLSDEQAAANYLAMERFPDQSQINRSVARQACGQLVIDIDQCGLTANVKCYELTRKGYFPCKRGQQSYQISMVYIGAYDEAVQLYEPVEKSELILHSILKSFEIQDIKQCH